MTRVPPTADGAEPHVMVEFVSGLRVPAQEIADADHDEIAARSKHALEAAMSQVRAVMERVGRLQTEAPANFKQMQVDFGIKLDWEAGALLANNQNDASITVKLTWDRDSAADQTGLPTLLAEVPVTANAEAPVTPTGLIHAIEVESTEEAP